MPKVLFVKPRDFVTYCSHRWRKDGTQVIVNQACEHEDMPGVMEEGQGEVCRGFALRGANCELQCFLYILLHKCDVSFSFLWSNDYTSPFCLISPFCSYIKGS